MLEILKIILFGLVRHFLSILVGFLLTHNLINQEEASNIMALVQEVVAVVIGILVIWWSVAEKRLQNLKMKLLVGDIQGVAHSDVTPELVKKTVNDLMPVK